MRKDKEEPDATVKWGWKFHHLGIPTQKQLPGETYLAAFRVFVTGFDTNPFGIEWMRYEEGSPVNELVKSVPHLAFEVDNIDQEIQKHDLKVLTPVNCPSEGVRVAMIEYDDAPVELIQFTGGDK